MQQTLRQPLSLSGTGLHSGQTVSLRLIPAPENHGIVFVRTDVKGKDNRIPASWDRVADTRLCTVIANEDGVTAGTIEHLMAALRGCGIDNAAVELDAPEVPIMDGSSAVFVEAIEAAGKIKQSAPRRVIRILKDIVVRDGDTQVRLSPAPVARYSMHIDFPHPDIGAQHYSLTLVNGNFRHDVADCRTFGFLKDVEALRAAGLARGGSLDNAVVFDDNGVMNPEGLRCADEMVRHKTLDAVGDIALAGGLIIGHYEGVRAGHASNNAVLHALFADESAWEYDNLLVEPDEAAAPVYKTKARVPSAAAA